MTNYPFNLVTNLIPISTDYITLKNFIYHKY